MQDASPTDPQPAGTREALVLLVLLFLPALVVALLFWKSAADSAMPGTDFRAFYHASEQLLAGNARVYDRAILDSYAAREENGVKRWPYPYPPPMNFIILPLAQWSHAQAFFLWSAFGAVFFALAVAATLLRMAPRWGMGRCIGMGLALSLATPFTLADTIAGQSGHFFGGLMVMALFSPHALISGAALGALSLKPQLAVACGIILLVARKWRPLGIGFISALALAVLAAWWWGTAIWVDFLDYMPHFSAALRARPDALQALTVSVYTSVLLLGAPAWLAAAAQLASAALALAVLWHIARCGGRWLLPLAGLATLPLMLPYVMWHDLAVLGLPTLALILSGREKAFRPGDMAVLALVFLGSVASVLHLNREVVNISAVYPCLLLWLIWRNRKRLAA